MSDVSNEDSDIQWSAFLDLLRQGKTAEIPCATERDYVRRTEKISKRAERKGIAIDVIRGEGVLRVEPRPSGGDAVTVPNAGEGAKFEEERQERQERREARRAER